MANPDNPNEIRLVVPLEISIRLAGSAGIQGVYAGAQEAAQPARKTLARGAEAVKIDADYSNRPGFAANFLPGVALPLPQMKPALARQIAPLRAEEPHPEKGELKYEHFTVVLNKARRMAIFTATNIDGPTYLTVDRATGQVGGSEGETWFKDPRVSASFALDQTFYSAWSTYFDRGHLTRRTDPTWGTEVEAERANADTFHFTNCSPQHFRFNETTKYWQGVERYVLENGLLATDPQKRLSVFQGPVFDNQVDLWADDVQIPSRFFKIVAWKGAHGLKSVGLMVDQAQLLSEERRSLGAPHEVASVNVSQWRVAIKEIEKKTGLDFGDDIRNADSFGAAQPDVGGEAATVRLIKSFDDLLA